MNSGSADGMETGVSGGSDNRSAAAAAATRDVNVSSSIFSSSNDAASPRPSVSRPTATAPAAASASDATASTAMQDSTNETIVESTGGTINASSSGHSVDIVPNTAQVQATDKAHLRVGRMVSVARRTWPGMNRQGGVGRVVAVHTASSSDHSSDGSGSSNGAVTHVDVRYVVVGGRERRVPVEYVLAAPEYENEFDDDDADDNDGDNDVHDNNGSMLVQNNGGEDGATDARTISDERGIIAGTSPSSTEGVSAEAVEAAVASYSTGGAIPSNAGTNAAAANSGTTGRRGKGRRHLRDRSMLLGRCGLCGSLRSDCGSCDWVALEARAQAQAEANANANANANAIQAAQAEAESSEGRRRGEDGREDRKGLKKSSTSSSTWRRNKKKKAAAAASAEGRHSPMPPWSTGSSASDLDSDSSYDDDMALNEIKRRRERMYSKLLKESGWEEDGSGGGSGGGSGSSTSRSRGGGSCRRARKRRKNGLGGGTTSNSGRRRIIADDEGSSSSSSNSNRSGDRSSSSGGGEPYAKKSKAPTTGTGTTRRRYAPASSSGGSSETSSSSSSSSDDMDDPILARLASIRSFRGNRAGKTGKSTARKRFMNRYTGAARSASTARSAKGTRPGNDGVKPRGPTPKSSLESLPAKDATTTSDVSLTVAPTSGPAPAPAPAPTSDVIDMTEDPEDPATLYSPPRPSSRTGCVDDDDNIGEIEMTQGDFELSEDDEGGAHSRMEVTRGETNDTFDEDNDSCGDYDDFGARAAAVEEDDPLRLDSTFIQPEGQQAAKALPEDTIDRTKSIPYTSLPTFFDDCANKIENEALPDAKIQVEELGMAVREMRRRRGNNTSGTEETMKSPAELENEAVLLFSALRRTLIRYGTDQCRAALRRLNDREEHKRAKAKAKSKGPSSDEVRQFRRIGKQMDLRELRMDSLDENVEHVLRKCHDLLDGFIVRETPSAGMASGLGGDGGTSREDGALDDDDGDESIDASNRYETVALNDNGSTAGIGGDGAELGKYNPHMHASKARRKKRERNKGAKSDGLSNASLGVAKRKRAGKRSKQSHDRRGESDLMSRDECRDSSGGRPTPKASSGRRLKGTRKTKPMNVHDEDEAFINNDVSDEDMIPMEALPLDLELRSARSVERAGDEQSRGLRVSFLDDDGGFSNETSRSRQESTKSASERMQEFLDNNSSTASIADVFTSTSSGDYQRTSMAQPSGRKRASKSARSRSGKNRIQSSGSNSLRDGGNQRSRSSEQVDRDHSSAQHGVVSPDALFEELASEDPVSNAPPTIPAVENVPPEQPNIPQGSAVSELCKRLLDAYPVSPRLCHELLIRIGGSASSCTEAIVFDTLSSLYQTHGEATLLDMIINGPSEQTKALHLTLLLTTMNLISNKTNDSLPSANVLTQKLFSPSSQHKFVEEVLLQLIDVLYAHFLPQAWANCADGKLSSTLWRKLRHLTDAIGRVTPIVETASRLLVTSVIHQAWYHSTIKGGDSDVEDNMFVSSVDPQAYRSFLKADEKRLVDPATVRFYAFKMAIPRSEIKALWAIIAFVGKSSSVTPSSSHWYRYKHIVRRLFYSEAAVLASSALSSSQTLPSPPSKDHISTCEAELLRLSILLRSGSLDPLPEQDGVLTSLMQKSLSLQADSLRYNINNAVRLIPRQNYLKDKSLLRKIWDASNVTTPSSPIEEVEMRFLRGLGLIPGASSNGTSGDDLTLFADGIDPCLALAASWMERLPRDKKARWIRLVKKDLDKCVNTLAEKATSLDKVALDGMHEPTSAEEGKVDEDVENDFFSSIQGLNRNKTAGPTLASSYYRESAAMLLIASSTLLVRAVKRPQSTGESVLNDSFCTRVWHMVSDRASRQRRDHLMNGGGDPPPRSSNFFLSLTASKAMATLAFLHLGVGSNDDALLSTDAKCDSLSFLVSCVVVSLDSICNILLSEVKRRNEAILFPPHEESSFFRPTEAMCVDAVGSICTWLSALMSRARHSLAHGRAEVREAVRHLGCQCLQMVISTVEVSFAGLVQIKQADSNLDLSFRSSLAVLRNAIGLYHETSSGASVSITALVPHQVGNDNVHTPSVNNAGNGGSANGGNDDIFGGLDDEAFMNIDLDNLSGQSTPSVSNSGSTLHTASSASPNVTERVDALAKGKIWSLLTDAIDASKPSQRYAIDTRMTVAPSSTSSSFSSAGKALCSKHSGAICSCLAALCSIRTEGSVHFQTSFEDIFSGRRSAQHATDQQSLLADRAFLKNTGQYLSYELCLYSLLAPSCEAIVRSGIEQIMSHFLECLVDTEILHRLPSSNKSIISGTGGPRAQEKEVKYLKRMLRRAPADGSEDEALGTRLLDDEYFDSPGPAFMSSRLWSFSCVLGGIMSSMDNLPSDEQTLRGIAKVLLDSDSDLGAGMSESSSRSLTLVPLISMERECMKRFIRLRGIVSVILAKEYTVGRVGIDIICRITETLLQNIYYLSATVEYNDRRTGDWSTNNNADLQDLYERSRALALQRAYAEGASAYLSWLLRECACRREQQQLAQPIALIKEVVLRTSLQRSNRDFCSALEGQVTTSSFSLDMLTSKGAPSVTHRAQANRLAEDLAAGLDRRIYELTLYAAATYDSSNSTDVLTLLIESAIDSSCLCPKKQFLFGCALRGEHSYNDPTAEGGDINSDDLQRAVDSYLFNVNRSTPLTKEDDAILGKLRRVALRNFFVPKLCFPTIEKEKKARVLLIMCSLFDVGGIVHLCSSASPSQESEGLFDISDVCLTARGLSYVLKETLSTWNTSDSSIIQTIFRVARLLIQLPVATDSTGGEEPLLIWARVSTRGAGGASLSIKFILQFCRWMNLMARLLTDDACPHIIQRIASYASANASVGTETSHGLHRWTTDLLKDLNMIHGESGQTDMGSIKSVLEIAEQLSSMEDELYPEDVLTAGARASVKNVYAKRFVPAAAAQGSSEGPSTACAENMTQLKLDPRCKRSAKEYIAKFIEMS